MPGDGPDEAVGGCGGIHGGLHAGAAGAQSEEGRAESTAKTAGEGSEYSENSWQHTLERRDIAGTSYLSQAGMRLGTGMLRCW